MGLTSAFSLARLRALLGNRREAPRLHAVREVSVAAGAVANWPAHGSFTGRTLDLSPKGLSILADGKDCEGLGELEGSSVTVLLALPAGTITFQAKVIGVRPAQAKGGCVIGAEVERMGGEERRRLHAFLESSDA